MLQLDGSMVHYKPPRFILPLKKMKRDNEFRYFCGDACFAVLVRQVILQARKNAFQQRGERGLGHFTRDQDLLVVRGRAVGQREVCD